MFSALVHLFRTSGRRFGVALTLCIGGCIFVLSVIHAAVDPSAHEAEVRKAYDAKIASTYSYPFPADADYDDSPSARIAFPGNAAIQGNNFIQPGAFPTAKYCEHCHQAAYHEWRQSLHAISFRSPFYRTSVNLLIKTKGIAYTRHCDSCHNPIGVLTGSLTPNAQGDRSFDRSGVTCMVCHSIVRIGSHEGNGSYVMGIPAVVVDDKGNRIPGEVPDSVIMGNPDRHVAAVTHDFMHNADFCATCHQANLPPELNGYKWLPAFSTYQEWQGSRFSQQSPLVFYTGQFQTCQDCHMKEEPIKLPDYGETNGMLASHRWEAGNTAVPFYYGYSEQLRKTIAFLKSGNYLNIDLFGLKLNNQDQLIGPLGSVPFTLPPAATVEVYVVIQNKGIGHSLLPEVRDLYQAWVSFTAKDASGAVIYRSGYLKPDGSIDAEAHIFNNRPVDIKGNFVDDHQVWLIHSVAYDNTIQSGRSTLVRYKFRLPASVRGPITISASVDYRHLRKSYTDNVLGKNHPAYPIVELASRSRTLNIGGNVTTAPLATDNPDWMRWNNLGISLMDELQYPDAMHAFEQVVKMRPRYADGYINIALDDINWEHYANARAPLDKALTLRPEDSRAYFYLALIERRERNTVNEDADLNQVLSHYPNSRDARRELGISYYQQNRPADAMKQFIALQGIDPDDLAAHYNLAILYRRMGMAKKAREQAAQFAIKRIDPGAPTYSLDYLRKHPEIKNESAPWHVHTDIGRSGTEAGQP